MLDDTSRSDDRTMIMLVDISVILYANWGSSPIVLQDRRISCIVTGDGTLAGIRLAQLPLCCFS
jgi:hypothetical protein